MSHHWNEQPDSEMARQMREMFPSPSDQTGALAERLAALEAEHEDKAAYPDGRLDSFDKGRFRYEVTANTAAQVVRIDFGSPVTAIGLTLAELESLIEGLEQAKLELRGITV